MREGQSNSNPQFCLGSASPRRAELLHQLGYRFTVAAADIDETPRPEENAPAFVRRMALEKGTALLERGIDLPILTADTVVVVDEAVLGKPATREDAVSMLQRLSGRSHHVLTAVAMTRQDSAQQALVQDSRVHFSKLNDAAIDQYISTGEPMDKAGGYGIQGFAAAFVKRLEGSYSGVMGLPLHETSRLLQDIGIQWGQAGSDRGSGGPTDTTP